MASKIKFKINITGNGKVLCRAGREYEVVEDTGDSYMVACEPVELCEGVVTSRLKVKNNDSSIDIIREEPSALKISPVRALDALDRFYRVYDIELGADPLSAVLIASRKRLEFIKTRRGELGKAVLKLKLSYLPLGSEKDGERSVSEDFYGDLASLAALARKTGTRLWFDAALEAGAAFFSSDAGREKFLSAVRESEFSERLN